MLTGGSRLCVVALLVLRVSRELKIQAGMKGDTFLFPQKEAFHYHTSSSVFGFKLYREKKINQETKKPHVKETLSDVKEKDMT